MLSKNITNIVGDTNNVNFSVDDFKRVREENFLYADKTKFIEDMLTNNKSGVLLFTRPRRFGKTLNLSMFKYFFDIAEDTRELFKGLYIEKSHIFEENLNKYPVINFNFKNINITTELSIQKSISEILNNTLEELIDRYKCEQLKQIIFENSDGTISYESVKKITTILEKHTGKKVIVLVDEYDNVINRAYGKEYWQNVCETIKGIFGALFKTNSSLLFAMLTGVSKIGKELGFSDLNNIGIYGLTNKNYYTYYGLTEDEVKKMFELQSIEVTKEFYEMYNGYGFDETGRVFNTSSILKFLSNYIGTKELQLSSYWLNNTTNNILTENIKKMDINFKDKLISLVGGEEADVKTEESINYDQLYKYETMFSLLIDTGYLCPSKRISGNIFTVRVPNREVLYGYSDMIESIVGVRGDKLANICENLIEGKTERFEETFSQILMQASSYNDFKEKENSYHCLMLGALLYLLDSHIVKSNRESGKGRYDIVIIPKEVYKKKYRPIIIEFKVAKESTKQKKYTEEELEDLANTALKQIEDREYHTDYLGEYKKEDFILFGIGAQSKECKVVSMTDNYLFSGN